MSSLSSSDQEAIIQLCERHEEAHHSERYYHRCVEFGPWFIKYNDHVTLEAEYKTQEYLFSKALGDSSAPCIARVVAYFTSEPTWGYLVSERIDPIRPPDTAPEAVARAIQWLRRVPRPSGLILGSVGGGRLRHRVFKDSQAPYCFSSVQALQNYMNKALLVIPSASRPAEMHFLDDPLIFTQSDMNSGNFALDADGRVCMFDFSDVGVLPESFAGYTLKGQDPFFASVARYLDWVDNPNGYSMARVRMVLTMMADPSLGLDMHGLPKSKTRI